MYKRSEATCHGTRDYLTKKWKASFPNTVSMGTRIALRGFVLLHTDTRGASLAAPQAIDRGGT